MAGRIPDETLQAVRERVSIVEVVSGYVTLKKAGRNYLGLCPFHAEKTPSFTVNDERGLFHCFGCGVGGTVFTFLMRADRIEFPEAVEALAQRAGVALPKRSEQGPGGEQRQELFELNEVAQRYFRDALRGSSGVPARQYLDKRGVSAATIERYGLGFCPPAGSGLARTLASKRQGHQRAIELGLIGRRNDGSAYDRFWGRVTFPIRDGSGRIVGFGGRTLGSEHPKYLNSPESTLFHKGHVLYGLFEARDAIRAAERVVLVEGYLDAIALVEAGIGHAVASLGTAFTPTQLKLARRFASEVVAFFDGDRAGQDAADRAFDVFAEADVWGVGAFLPEGVDPDTYVRTHGASATMTLLQNAIPLADFVMQRADPGPTANMPQRASAAKVIGQRIARVRDAIKFDLLAKQAAQRLGVDESIFRDVRATPSAPTGRTPVAESKPLTDSLPPEERTLIEAMALDRDVALLVGHRGVLDAFSSSVLADAGRSLLAAWERENSSASAIDELPATLAGRVTEGLLGEGAMASGDRLQVARDCIERVEYRRRRQHNRALVADLRQAEANGDEGRVRDQLQRQDELNRRREIRGD